ncbi:MBL fold metallo-hydrolase [Sphingobacterium sp. lm-10]|uniref:MBL fold metallo-hydrolase n=1 Tax=Sphingobacterium sp. lm-10 TaxID=2944904 RepID=UPI0020212C8E|nr:MBL fold metallo-hydrolase [Sphingobacterium sp. lm-10]MCL7987639.1 MBL fold metallo-hydrolase [Sphingobacterium sp. lm-10]
MRRRLFIRQSLFAFAIAGTNKILSCTSTEAKPVDYEIKQFEDEGLSHFSYAIEAGKKLVLIDPSRDPQPYYDYAAARGAEIIAVIETHTHADFVSAHLQIHQERNVPVLISKLAKATYPHQPFDESDLLSISDKVSLRAINTPGHSSDSLSVVLEVDGNDVAVFTGDALLLGGVGRPDLREYSGEAASQREYLAKQMYETIHNKYSPLADDVLVYPAHGAGSLCGNGLSEAKVSTIGHERKNNFAFQSTTEDAFVTRLLLDQPDVPVYFPFAVEVNRDGAQPLLPALSTLARLSAIPRGEPQSLIVDTRSAEQFRAGHLPGAINIPDRRKSETWLGTLVAPDEPFYLIVEDQASIQPRLEKIGKIGYEALVKGVLIYDEQQFDQKSATFDTTDFKANPTQYLILDVRSEEEAKAKPVFAETKVIPLSRLKEQLDSINTDKPIAVHCASGYRSAVATSLIKKHKPEAQVLDIGENIKQYGDDHT